MKDTKESSTQPKPVIQWPDSLARDAYHGLAGRIVDAIAPQTESDPVALITQLLLFFGDAIGRQVDPKVEADRHGLNLYVVLVGATSKGRKVIFRVVVMDETSGEFSCLRTR